MGRALVRLGVQPELAPSVVQYLNDEGLELVPVTIIGASGWTPEELWAYKVGYMTARRDTPDSKTAFPPLDEE
jgi:hypothetical protein